MPVVRTDGLSLACSVYGHVITKFSRMGRLPQFFSYRAAPTRGSKRRGGAPLLNLLIFLRSRCRRRNLRSSYLNTKDCKQGVLTIYTNHPGGNLVHKLKAVKFDVVRDNPPQLFKSAQKKLNLVEKLQRLKSQPMLSEASQTEWREPFHFPTKISGFPLEIVRLSTHDLPNPKFLPSFFIMSQGKMNYKIS